MRVLIIGGSGFIGPHIVGAFVQTGHEVTVFHRGRTPLPPGAREIIGDRRDLAETAPAGAAVVRPLIESLRALRPDLVVDVVLSSGKQARDLMRVFRGHARRVVALSSMDVYRACGVTHRLEEGGLEPLPLAEDSSALRTKLQTYPPAQIQMLQQVFGWVDDAYDKIPVEREILADRELPGTILRLPMVYGPGDPLHRFHPIVKRILDGRRAILFSSAMAGWRATKGYVEDVGAAVAAVALSDRTANRIYNVGERDTLSELEWAQEIAKAMKWDGDFVVLPEDELPPHLRFPGNTAQHWIGDTTRIRQEIGFQEQVSREEAVRRTVAWQAAHTPEGVSPHQFDYPTEDAALAKQRRASSTPTSAS